jgi:hypothetical protein
MAGARGLAAFMAEVPEAVREIAMAAQAHINRHEIECGKRWLQSTRAFDDLSGQVERMAATLHMAQMFILKGGFWLIGILAGGLVGAVWWIITHPPH